MSGGHYTVAVVDETYTMSTNRLQAFAKEALRFASDEALARPLWDYNPAARKAVISERRRRGILPDPDETVTDPTYS
ncbi:hypothetical protein HOS57_gp33 [Streptomyces phage AbbeyMikolon]|uniref:Uncharacterized protein n=1 Tax=Streptomyces phage AbbeyMikolon TaxID=2059880 RepID=A0A2H5BLG4_9CAUD|nr:hypothetical protein HOS57_gp33 [Streptomyces phage AbbeyMikolon]AUG87105.1 hypothetical protein SEA_ABBEYMIKOLON_33 [Streptomyces phage AbbeyMikolon]